MYYSAKTSRHRQNGLSYVPKKILTWMLRETGGGLKATVCNRVKPNYLFTLIVFCSFLFLSARFLCSLAGYTQKHVITYWTLWAYNNANGPRAQVQRDELVKRLSFGETMEFLQVEVFVL